MARLLLMAGVVIALLVGAASVLAGIRETVMLSSPEVRAAQARQSIAESNYRTAELNRQTADTRAQGAAEAAWKPWTAEPRAWPWWRSWGLCRSRY
ncbi:MAG: hypothetical protein JF922_20565 [Candidatus Dormibacteraeota bacterium]|uniref:Uncharacterized protein n=2 Tax=Candidatus Nephthysia bennettiae TaxID=3127016 RepID=A0A934KBZ8_9BACT|nr:hypothetical protein [Candidatus Dormibacteraeota bacterium]MBJ7611924.1 hypothetical protein [Candidatus Dormibacteraeota bacterium]